MKPTQSSPRACPLCDAIALGKKGEIVTCAHCSSVFVYDAESHTVCYTHLAEEFEQHAPQLTTQWLTRTQVYAIVGKPIAQSQKQTNKPLLTLALLLISGVLIGAMFLANWVPVHRIDSTLPTERPTVTTLIQPTATQMRSLISSPTAAAIASPLNSPLAATAIPPTLVPILEAPPTATQTRTSTHTPLPSATVTATITNTPTAVTIDLGATSPLQVITPTLPPTFTPAPTSVEVTVTATPTSAASAAATAIPSTTANVTPTPSLTATPVPTDSVRIVSVSYLGDAGSNESDEYVEVQNFTTNAIGMTNWTLISVDTSRAFAFPNGFVLQPNQKCRIYSGVVSSIGECGNLSFGFSPVWSNTTDIAELRDPLGRVVSKFSYGNR